MVKLEQKCLEQEKGYDYFKKYESKPSECEPITHILYLLSCFIKKKLCFLSFLRGNYGKY